MSDQKMTTSDRIIHNAHKRGKDAYPATTMGLRMVQAVVAANLYRL